MPSTLTPRHHRLVGDGVDDRGEVHEHVDPLEHGLELRTGDVDQVELERPRTAARLADVEPDDAGDAGLLRQAGDECLAHEPRHPGDGDAGHLHRLTECPTTLNPGTTHRTNRPHTNPVTNPVTRPTASRATGRPTGRVTRPVAAHPDPGSPACPAFPVWRDCPDSPAWPGSPAWRASTSPR